MTEDKMVEWHHRRDGHEFEQALGIDDGQGSLAGEENGNPFQCSCLENPRDCGAWWAAVYGVAQSWTQPKRLRGSSGNSMIGNFFKVLVLLSEPD